MKVDAKEQETIRQYLLGRVPQEDCVPLEERLISDGDFYEEILIAEDELIDSYLANQLSESERQSFETNFLLTTKRQQKVRFARNLRTYVSEASLALPDEETEPLDFPDPHSDKAEPSPKKRRLWSFLPAQNPILSYSLAAAVLLVVFGASWVILKNWRTQTPREPGNILAVTLTPGLIREGGEIKKISITPGTDTIQLRLELAKTEYMSYRGILLADDRSEVWTADALPATRESGKNFVVANVPAGLLNVGDYQMKVSGRLTDGTLEDLASYPFRVAR